jgi:hypothetical protein
VEAYDLLLDPGEQDPLELDARTVAQALERAEGWWRKNPPPAPSLAETRHVSERLQALGYAGDE